MRIRLHIFCVALATAVLAGGATEGTAAALKGRAGLAARQLVRSEMVAAIADGKLTVKERKYILALSKQAFGEEELERVEASLDGLAARRGITVVRKEDAPAAKPMLAKRDNDADRHSADLVKQTSLIEPSPTPADQPTPAADKTTDDGGSPFHEEPVETTPDETITFDDETITFDDGTITFDDGTILYEDGQQKFGSFCAAFDHGLKDVTLSSTVDAFKGPLDLDNQNGNFGFQFGINGALPLYEPLGIGIQGGTSAILSDLHGTQFTGSTIRTQQFTTIGLFQRNMARAPKLSWGFAYDWLHDDYYASMHFSQWRVKLGYQLQPQSEVGIWASIPDRGDTAVLRHDRDGQVFRTTERFRPISQGNLYYTRCWETGTRTTMWAGIADEPGQFIFGADARVPMGERLSLVGNFNYVLPSASGVIGQDEEMWNVSIGLELTLGACHNHCAISRFAPFFPLANNAIFGIRRF